MIIKKSAHFPINFRSIIEGTRKDIIDPYFLEKAKSEERRSKDEEKVLIFD